eukprot:59545_1
MIEKEFYLLLVKSIKNNMVFLWFNHWTNNERIRKTFYKVLPSITYNVSDLMMFNVGYDSTYYDVITQLNKIKSLLYGLEYGSDNYIKIAASQLSQYNNNDNDNHIDMLTVNEILNKDINYVKVYLMETMSKPQQKLINNIVSHYIVTSFKKINCNVNIKSTLISHLQSYLSMFFNFIVNVHDEIIIDNKHKSYSIYLSLLKDINTSINNKINIVINNNIDIGIKMYNNKNQNISQQIIDENNKSNVDVDRIINEIDNGQNVIISATDLNINKTNISESIQPNRKCESETNNYNNYLLMIFFVNSQCLKNILSLTIYINEECPICDYNKKECYNNNNNNCNNSIRETIECKGCKIEFCIQCISLKVKVNPQNMMLCGLCAGNNQVNLVQFVTTVPDKNSLTQTLKSNRKYLITRINKNVSVDLCVIPNNLFANACYVLHTLEIVSNTLCMKYHDFNEQKHLSHIFGIILSNMKFRNIYGLLNIEKSLNVLLSQIYGIKANEMSNVQLVNNILHIITKEINEIKTTMNPNHKSLLLKQHHI